MSEIESFVADRLRPLFKIHYALWVLWWPWWREKFSGPGIMRNWRHFHLVRRGQTFMDFGCGTGSFTLPAARLVGKTGKVYAVDCFPRQLKMVEEKSRKIGLTNIETLLTEGSIALPDQSVDVIWVCDVLHEIKDRRPVLMELHRVLRKDGTLVIYDGMREKILGYTNNLFTAIKNDDKFYLFSKI